MGLSNREHGARFIGARYRSLILVAAESQPEPTSGALLRSWGGGVPGGVDLRCRRASTELGGQSRQTCMNMRTRQQTRENHGRTRTRPQRTTPLSDVVATRSSTRCLDCTCGTRYLAADYHVARFEPWRGNSKRVTQLAWLAIAFQRGTPLTADSRADGDRSRYYPWLTSSRILCGHDRVN